MHYNYFRDYDPQTGRYVQSDPAGLVDGPNTFLYARARPISITDRLGLASDEECCRRSMELGQHRDPPSSGWTLCCEGRKVACANDPYAPGKAASIRRKCTMVHERDHLPYTTCESCTKEPVRTSFSPGVDRDRAECSGTRKGIECLKNSINECGNDEACRRYIRDKIASLSIWSQGCGK